MLKAKICGLREKENIQEIAALKPDYIGLMFWPGSSRYVGENWQTDNLNLIKRLTVPAGVFVNQTVTEILETAKKFGLDIVQLHGSESPAMCLELQSSGLEIIKAIPATSRQGIQQQAGLYSKAVSMLLLDTPTQKHGGTGISFPHEILIDLQLPLPYFLSGGLNAESILNIPTDRLPGLIGFDASSKLEISPGLKSVEKCMAYIEAVKHKMM
ncbi:MAG: phosphoribosylanthranilate isomerase [Bacteroidota bacterium]